MDQRVERVVLETDRYRVIGDVHLPREGYRSRLSDYLNRTDDEFVVLADAEIHALGGDSTGRRSFIAVGRSHVRLAYPLDER